MPKDALGPSEPWPGPKVACGGTGLGASKAGEGGRDLQMGLLLYYEVVAPGYE